jgi:hypothetical protein
VSGCQYIYKLRRMPAYPPAELRLKTGHDSISNSRAQIRLYTSVNWKKKKESKKRGSFKVVFTAFPILLYGALQAPIKISPRSVIRTSLLHIWELFCASHKVCVVSTDINHFICTESDCINHTYRNYKTRLRSDIVYSLPAHLLVLCNTFQPIDKFLGVS